MSTAEPSAPEPRGRPAWRSAALGAAVVVAAVLAFALLRGDDDDPAGSGARPTGTSGAQAARPEAATPQRLAELAESVGHPVYWVGEAPRRTYELTRTADASVYVRYLDAGVRVGDPRPDFLTVGTYPQPDPYETVEDATKRTGAQVEELEDDGLAVANRARPNSWYLAYPDSEVLVEVFSPDPGRARELVRGDDVVPVAG